MHYIPNAYSEGGVIVATGKSTAKTIANAVNLQDVSSKADGGCPSTLTTGQSYTLKDSRDNKEYKVARLADGNCWMLDNLRLYTTTVGLTRDNSNVPYTSENAWYLPTSMTSGFTVYTTKKLNASYIENTVTSWGDGSGKVGVYYNYCAASGGTYCYESSTDNAAYDICPKGWRMPTGGSSGEYQSLYEAYNENQTNFKAALSTPLSGMYDGDRTVFYDTIGAFWSSTYCSSAERESGKFMYRMELQSGSVSTASSTWRRAANTIRCVLK